MSLPEPRTLAGCLLLADRGYPNEPHFEAVAAARGAFIVRLSRSDDPWMRAAWVEGRAVTVSPRLRLSRLLALQHRFGTIGSMSGLRAGAAGGCEHNACSRTRPAPAAAASAHRRRAAL